MGVLCSFKNANSIINMGMVAFLCMYEINKNVCAYGEFYFVCPE